MAGVSSEGLKTTAFPAARAYAIEPIGVNAGKFHGPMTPITPRGRYSSRDAVLLAVSRVRTHAPSPQHALGVACRPVQVVDDGQDALELGVRDRLAVLAVHQLGQPAHVPGQVRLPGEQPDPPLGPAEPGPPHRGLAGLAATAASTSRRPCTGKVASTSPVAGLTVSSIADQ